MVSVVKDKTNKIKYFFNDESDEGGEKCEEGKNKNCRDKKKKPFLNIQYKLLQNYIINSNKKVEDSAIENCNMGDGSRDEVISVFVKTSRRLQDMVRGYEAKVNQTTTHITCLQHHIYSLHEQLAHKNKMIGRVCGRYVALCKEKQAAGKHFQKKIDELSSVVEACVKNDTPQLQRLLIQQVEKNKYLEYHNEILSQRIADLGLQKPHPEPKIK